MARSDSGTVSPPGGSGLTSGLGEAMRLDLNTGQSVYSLPLKVPKGVADHTPSLRLEYSGSAPNGPFGLGWRLPVRAIHRRLDLGVPDDGPGAPPVRERFCDGDLELAALADGSFAPMVETAFHRYERVGEGWIITERSGVRHELGTTAATRVSHPSHPDRIVAWLLARSIDTSGNEIAFSYAELGDRPGTPVLTSIRWAAYRLDIEYGPRPDTLRDGRAGFLRELAHRATSITVAHVDGETVEPIRSWSLSYDDDPASGASLLAGITVRGHRQGADVALPPVRFRYGSFDPTDITVRLMDHEGSTPPPLDDPDTTLATLDDSALPGVLQVHGGVHVYWPNVDGSTFGPPRVQRDAPNVDALGRAGAQLLDTDGNGTPDLVVAAGGGRLRGYYRNGGSQGWRDFVAYPRGAGDDPPWGAGARPLDLNGDGVVDAVAPVGRSLGRWVNQGAAGWLAPTVTATPEVDGRRVDLTDPLVRFADMTGDGLLDLVEIRSGGLRYWPSLGNGHFAEPVLMASTPRLAGASDDPAGVVLVDLSGDGCADLVQLSGRSITIAVNRSGSSFGPALTHPVVPVLPGTVRVVDIAGTGRASLVWNTVRGSATPIAVASVGSGHPFLLTQIDNSQGLVSTIEYGSSVAEALRDRGEGEGWSDGLPFPLTVVTGTTETDVVSGRTARIDYRYHDGHYDPLLRSFAGFTRVEQIERGDASRPDRITIHHYSAGHAFGALNRLLELVEVRTPGPDGHPLIFRRESTSYDVAPMAPAADGAQRHFVFARRVRVAWADGTADERVEERTYQYDDHGNVVREDTLVSGRRDGTPVPLEGWSVESTYAHDDTRHVHDRVARVIRRARDGTLLGEVRHHYDGPDFVGLPLGRVERGLLTRKQRLVQRRVDFDAHYGGVATPGDLHLTPDDDVDGKPALFAELERKRYDDRGLLVAERDEVGVEQRREYDADGLFAIRKVGPLGVTTIEVDHHAGEPSRIVDGDGTEVLMRYDGLGRTIAAAFPGDTLAEPTRRYSYDTTEVPVRVAATYRRSAASDLDIVTYYDGSGQEVQRRVAHAPGKVVVSGWKEHNRLGDVIAEYEPTLDTDLGFGRPNLTARPHRAFEYDVEGRAIVTRNYDGAVSRLAIAPFEARMIDPIQDAAGVTRRDELDARRRRVAVHEPTETGDLTTRFKYGELGELLSVDDHRSRTVDYVYDMAGQRLTIDHRDAGRRRLFYDAAGRVVATIDAEGNRVEATFDDAGRISALRVNGAQTQRYTYDPTHPGGLGRLARVVYPGGAQSFRYTPRGQVAQVEWEFDELGAPQVVGYEYDGFGNETAIVHPDGTRIETDYYDNGWVRSVPGFVGAVEYDARGMATNIAFANGVTSETTYTDGVGRASSHRVVGPTGRVHEDLVFAHDALSRATTITDQRLGTTRTHAYDLLQQLTSVDDDGTVTAFTYDGRDVVTNGESDLELHYTDPLRPGLVTGTSTGGGAVEAVASDANGAITGLRGRQLVYDGTGDLVRVVTGATTVDLAYDHRGERTHKRVSTGGAPIDTFFVGDRTEISGGQTIVHVVVGSWRIAVRRGATTRWIHTDELGTGRFFTDETGRRIDGVTIKAFGNVDGGDVVGPQVFALHPLDAETGLYYARRRYYSAELGRWITPDGLYLQRPETDKGEPKTLALYAYVANDPVNYVDPMGRSFWHVLGGIVGVIVGVVLGALVIAAFATGIGFGILALVGIALLIGVGYVGAAAVDPTSRFGEFMQGFLIGVNAGLNGVLAGAIFGPVVGLALGVINFLAVFDEVRTNPVYQGILGWSNFVQPMSWLVVGLGLIFFALNLLGHLVFWVSGGRATDFEVTGFDADWSTGTFGVRGGWISNLNPLDTAFNMGNFVFTDNAATSDHFQHEIGHSLNLAIMGSFVHFAGAIDENGIRGHDALTEQMAESHDAGSTRGSLAGWWI